jgi:hypothetical protein
MARFDAVVRLLDVEEHDAWTARQALEERLRQAGFQRWQIVRLGLRESKPEPRRRRRAVRPETAGSGLLLSGVVAWVLWFLWVFSG